ncbi:MAG: DUF4123 domain-containing protein [Pseudomonadota bacterium]|nr:DUF4123 domain-containing protein [Pseudomonadota bacterium]
MAELLSGSRSADEPVRASYAVLDLAYHPSVLRWIYEKVEASQPGSWIPLFMETHFQERWQVGPALVDLRAAPDAFRSLLDFFSDGIPGVLLCSTGEDLNKMAQWLRTFLFTSKDAGASLIRFYDPRIFETILAVLDDRQHRQFVPAGVSWFWQSGLGWRSTTGSEKRKKSDDEVPGDWNFHAAQVDEFAWERRQEFVRQLHGKYGECVPSDNSVRYIDDAVTLAEACGLDSKADIERVLRACLQTRSEPTETLYRALAERPDLTATQKLEQIEHRKS